MPLWNAWLLSRGSEAWTSDQGGDDSTALLGKRDLQRLLEYCCGVSVGQDAGAAVLLAIRRLHGTNFYFVDMPQLRRVLQESIFSAFIPVVCKV